MRTGRREAMVSAATFYLLIRLVNVAEHLLIAIAASMPEVTSSSTKKNVLLHHLDFVCLLKRVPSACLLLASHLSLLSWGPKW